MRLRFGVAKTERRCRINGNGIKPLEERVTTVALACIVRERQNWRWG